VIIKSFLRAFNGSSKRIDTRCYACGMRRPLCLEACGFCVACCGGHDDEDEQKSWWSR
jgi:hypothetical protein